MGGREYMESVLNALVLLMELHIKNFSSHEANKALRSVVDKIDRFNGKILQILRRCMFVRWRCIKCKKIT